MAMRRAEFARCTNSCVPSMNFGDNSIVCPLKPRPKSRPLSEIHVCLLTRFGKVAAQQTLQKGRQKQRIVHRDLSVSPPFDHSDLPQRITLRVRLSMHLGSGIPSRRFAPNIPALSQRVIRIFDLCCIKYLLLHTTARLC